MRNHQLIIVPYNAKYIHIYDLQNGRWEQIDYPGNESYGRKYVEAFAHNDKIIMIGAFAPNIIELDMNTKKVRLIDTL